MPAAAPAAPDPSPAPAPEAPADQPAFGRPAPGAVGALGYDDGYAAALRALPASRELFPVRATRVDRGACDALAADGPLRLSFGGAVLAAAAADPVAVPCTGDWLAARAWPDGRLTVEHVLPRRTSVVRAMVTPGSSQGQVLAANVDIVAVVEGLMPEPDLGRIERFLAIAWQSGATPLVVLTKADLAADAELVAADVAAAAPGVDVVVVSTVTADGTAALDARLRPGQTVAMLGPSGAGKSSLTNALAGAELMPTRALRADGKGRHTTVTRELVPLAGGAWAVDTPGLRSVGLADAAVGALDDVFAEIEELARSCRFADCSHDAEPGCAVLAALDDGTLPERRLASYRKLLKEARYMAMRHDARLRAAERDRWRTIAKANRRRGTPKR